jgi:integrase
MKKRKSLLVPLSRQALSHLKKLHRVTSDGKYLFPGARSKARPMSENAITAALRGMGYTGDQMTAHGFRTMASTRLNEMVSHSKRKLTWDADCIEIQLAHDIGSTRGVYNRAKYIKGRTDMMQAWANYLDKLRKA